MAQGICIERYTGAAAAAIEFAPGLAWTLHQVRIHLDIAGGAVEDLTITNDGGITPAVYDTTVLTLAMNAVTDHVYTPDAPMQFDRTDVLDIAYANTNNRTWGIEIVVSYRE